MPYKSTFTGIRFPDATLKKAKYISWFERETFSARVINLIENDIAKWEKKNGTITEAQIKQAMKK